ELPHAVVALLDHLEAVHLQDVPEALVDEQSANGKVDRILDLAEDLLRVTARPKLLDGRADGELVHLHLVVDGERVVHVEADPVDPRHLEISVDEHAARAWDSCRLRNGKNACEGQAELFEHRGKPLPERYVRAYPYARGLAIDRPLFRARRPAPSVGAD